MLEPLGRFAGELAAVCLLVSFADSLVTDEKTGYCLKSVCSISVALSVLKTIERIFSG